MNQEAINLPINIIQNFLLNMIDAEAAAKLQG